MLRHMTTPSVNTRTGSQQHVIARRPSPWAYGIEAGPRIRRSMDDHTHHPVGVHGLELRDHRCCLLKYELGIFWIVTGEFIGVDADRFGHVVGECRKMRISFDKGLTRRVLQRTSDIDENFLALLDTEVFDDIGLLFHVTHSKKTWDDDRAQASLDHQRVGNAEIRIQVQWRSTLASGTAPSP
ncbi:hypothetical protein pRL120644 [Rhizobium johnstonii 3841]|uniref:Uncharacterized protein n=1 Tax=Rhizobium johnstonii (strain DSM 114642 / LMG 32736 / 3841) TaxID=216596 RepID=Q1M3H0_RHIJ3|nr:hypothetical protein pRL120644 [Rhizobium johnstonii 3841]